MEFFIANLLVLGLVILIQLSSKLPKRDFLAEVLERDCKDKEAKKIDDRL